jgi:hypothetical protein
MRLDPTPACSHQFDDRAQVGARRLRRLRMIHTAAPTMTKASAEATTTAVTESRPAASRYLDIEGGWWMRYVIAAVVGLTLTACTTSGSLRPPPARSPSSTTPGTHSSLGTISGHLLLVGGPSGVGPTPIGGYIVAMRAPNQPLVTAHKQVIGADGSFSVQVPPGRYFLSGTSPRFGNGTCSSDGKLTVTSGHTTVADVLCQMK